MSRAAVTGRRTLAGLARAARYAGLIVAFGLATSSFLAAAEKVPRVVATTKPIHSIVSAVLGDAGKAELLITGMTSPHAYALKPSDASLLNAADMFVRVSEQVEPFTARIAKALPAQVEVVTLAETEGLKLLQVRFGGHFDDHSHDAENELSADDLSVDGHIWLDPENGKLMARRLAGVFAIRWPEHADYFMANAERLADEIDTASQEIKAQLESVHGVPFVVFHDAYHYFEERFGLKSAGAIAINPEVPPGARRLSALRNRIKELGGVCAFAEPQFSTRVLDAVTLDTGARSGVLDPIGVDLEPGPSLYVRLLKDLAGGFASCLGKDPRGASKG